MYKKIVFFTGSGISVESGLSTYRLEDGLWNNFDINQVATSQAIKNDLTTVNSFFNDMRRQASKAVPNLAHEAIASLQDDYHITVITQNVDDLHEQAGTEIVYHLHGNIFETRTTASTKVVDNRKHDIEVDERDSVTNGRLRPNVVLFDEIPYKIETTKRALREADYVVVVGTSLNVQPANLLLFDISGKKPIYIIDPNPNFIEDNGLHFLKYEKHIVMKATEALTEIKQHFLKRK